MNRAIAIALLICGMAQAANDIEFVYPSGSTVYAIVRQTSTGKVWDNVASAWDTWTNADITDYDVPLTDRGGDYYSVSFPSAITSGGYAVAVYIQAGGSPAITDEILGSGNVLWTGTAARTLGTVALSSDGLDSVSMTEPTGVASNFREAVLALWMRFYDRVAMTSSLLTVYNASDTAVTEQDLSDNGTVQEMSKSRAP